jgi:hypothetical protein
VAVSKEVSQELAVNLGSEVKAFPDSVWWEISQHHMGPVHQEEGAEALTRNGGTILIPKGNHNLKTARIINVLVDPGRERRRLPMEEWRRLPCSPHLVNRTTRYA